MDLLRLWSSRGAWVEHLCKPPMAKAHGAAGKWMCRCSRTWELRSYTDIYGYRRFRWHETRD